MRTSTLGAVRPTLDHAQRTSGEPRTRVEPLGGPFDLATLRARGASTALIDGAGEISYRRLAELVERRCADLGTERRVVVLAGGNQLDTVVTWLAAFNARHPVALADGAAATMIADTIAADVVVTVGHDEAAVDHRTPPDARTHDLHPDLACLAATSGTTGGRQLVRLSRTAVEHNAWSIATYLELGERDRAITALPVHYCYGMSVVTSHLAVGASIVLTDTSVVDPCFWDLARRHAVTGLAGVPYTFEMIDRLHADVLSLPSLRYVTQAGGRMAPDAVVRYAELGRRYGWRLFVMYGQTEATARMAYLPPDDVFEHPTAVGRAIPGGTIRIADPDPNGVGEVVYRGPNVMMGYAHGPEDLGRGAELDELHTGDLGRINEHGLLEITGRSRRFVKLHGKRVSLDDIERALADHGSAVSCAGDDEGIVVAVERPGVTQPELDDELRDIVLEHCDVPAGRVIAISVGSVPRTTSGKVDGPALVDVGRAVRNGTGSVDESVGQAMTVREVFEQVLRRRDLDPDVTFAGLGGDSLSYVELSIRLEAVLGHLPDDWHLRTIADLEATHRTSRGRTVRMDTSVVIRAVAIALIVCTHMQLYRLPGGAHALLAVIGYNFARFQLPSLDVPGRVRRAVATIARVAVPTSLWIGLNMLIAGGYSVGALFLVNNYFGSPWRRDGRWHYWYFETFVQVMVVLALVFSIAVVRRMERRAPFGFALAVLAATLAIRFDVVVWGDPYNAMFRPHTVACFIALGWCAAVARTVPQRLLVTVALVVTTVGYFGQTDRELRIIAMVAALIWLPSIPVPRRSAGVIGIVGAASMYIFLVHWQVWPLFTPWFERHVAFVATMATGVAVWWMVAEAARRRAARRDEPVAATDVHAIGTLHRSSA